MLFLLSLFACSSPPACTAASPAGGAESSTASVQLESWEANLLAKPLEMIRKGIQPVADSGFGICLGVQKCESFLGPDPEVLPEGDYLAYAELNVPGLGDGWAAHFKLHCETTRPDGSSASSDYDRRYDVRNSGPNRGYRLSPMMRIKSPNSAGPKACTYTLTPIRPDGIEGEPWSGSYSTL
jgi:hypothetical protein